MVVQLLVAILVFLQEKMNTHSPTTPSFWNKGTGIVHQEKEKVMSSGSKSGEGHQATGLFYVLRPAVFIL